MQDASSNISGSTFSAQDLTCSTVSSLSEGTSEDVDCSEKVQRRLLEGEKMHYGKIKYSGAVSLKEGSNMVTALVCRRKLQREKSASSVDDT